ncbi:hypothetical protein [Duganella violaceipulchra]|uniref:Uncharacterized protein n=1 Tax=Duganella violaceipulchra TaxID=2849652 RepID=A0AA41HAL2_9BURK|nr:hypothetical protein [Duganella violaceicalia]MBV6323744.1 hypothetical protein [Duganella violaceicalia]MCP2007433.1 hypothetical protein [Duganella violaceicalia]
MSVVDQRLNDWATLLNRSANHCCWAMLALSVPGVVAVPDNTAVPQPTWIGPEQIVPVETVVGKLRDGEQVGTLFHVAGETVLGPNVVIGTNARGNEVIAVASWPHQGTRSLFALPEFN